MNTQEIAPRVPRGDAAGFIKFLHYDLISGLQVFLIALPLCLGISLTSGYPPLAGIFTAIIGALIVPWISNSELTIKGPAAGLIVIALGCIEAFGGDGMAGGWSDADLMAYRSALAVGVAAAVLQILFGIFRAGILGEFFPTSVVHGMLAAIGVIIISKQIPVVLGVSAKGEPLELLLDIPHFILEANPAIALIGVLSLLIMFSWPFVTSRLAALRPIPSAMVVLLIAVPLGMAFDLLHSHSYVLQGHKYALGEQYLVAMPDRMFGMFREITSPNFQALASPLAWKWVVMFFLIGTLESLLSAKAIEMLDPWKRKTDLDRDLIAVGTANLAAAMVGGLPMISEIVRSRANIDNGARTRFANFWHGLFLLLCVALIPSLLHRIPLAALAAMLVYTGFRLAHPHEFVAVYRIGREQLAIFLTTLVAVLATDLLIGIGIGIALKMIIHLINGVSLRSMFRPFLEVNPVDEHTSLVVARESAVFSNWIPFRRQIEQIGLIQRHNIIIDVTHAQLVDHSVMEKLGELQHEFEREGLQLELRGIETLQPLAKSASAARKRGFARARRLTIVAVQEIQHLIETRLVALGVSGYTVSPCRGVGRREVQQHLPPKLDCVRIEVIALPHECDRMLLELRRFALEGYRMTMCIESVDVLNVAEFTPAHCEVTQHEEEPESYSAVTHQTP